MLVEQSGLHNEPEWKTEQKKSLESLNQLFAKSLNVANQLISYSLSEKHAESVLEMFVKQVVNDFNKVRESIEFIKSHQTANFGSPSNA